MGIICIFVGFFSGQDAADILAVKWSRLCAMVVPFRVNIQGKKNYSRLNSYVVVANHQSMADIPAIHGFLGLKIKWVMKQELKNVPIFGMACKQLGCIYVDRSNRNAAIRSIEAARKKMSKTACALFFAEGTRSRTGELMPFKKGAFVFAMETGLPILPVTLRNSMDILPSGTLNLTPGTLDIVVHPPIHTSPQHTTNITDLMEQTWQAIVSAL